MAKNCKLLEEGFNEEYFAEHNRRAIERAERWTAKRFEWELEHLVLTEWITRVIVFGPVLYMIGRMLWQLYTR